MNSLFNKALFESIFFCALGLFTCFALQKLLSATPITSSILVGFAASFMPSSLKYDSKKAVAGVYTGSFSAMGSQILELHLIELLFLSLITGVSFYFFSNYCRGFGGKLGTIAFSSTLSLALIQQLL